MVQQHTGKFDFSIVSLNVRGLAAATKRKAIFTWLAQHKFDIIYLQETHSHIEIESAWKNEWGGKMIMSHGTSNSRGCMILFRKNLDIEVLEINTDVNGRLITLNCNIMDENFILTNIYAPNLEPDQVKFISELEGHLSKYNYSNENKHIIVEYSKRYH